MFVQSDFFSVEVIPDGMWKFVNAPRKYLLLKGCVFFETGAVCVFIQSVIPFPVYLFFATFRLVFSATVVDIRYTVEISILEKCVHQGVL